MDKKTIERYYRACIIERDAATAERDRLRAALEPVARGACLDQRVGHAEGYRCICFSCIARAALNQDKE